MPRPGPRRPLVNLRLAGEETAEVDRLAGEEGVNRSEMIRRLLKEAIVTRTQEDIMPTTALISPLSDGTKAAIANVIENMIEHEHGRTDRDAMVGARILALSGVQMDVARAFIDRNDGDDRGLPAYADTVLRHLVSEGLAARRCQCPLISAAGHVGRCEGHYESDVPEVDGVRVCGTCYAAEHVG